MSGPGGQRLRVLIVEDSDLDTKLILHELTRGGFSPSFSRVDSPEALSELLQAGSWDLVISDHSMPQFTGISALHIWKQSGRDVPFILVSGTIGEEQAVAAMKAGAHDYIMKGNLARLVPAVVRELREARVRTARRQAEETLRLLQKAVETIHLGVTIADPEGTILYANAAEAEMHGYTVEELVGQDVRIFSAETLRQPMTLDELRAMETWTRERASVARDGRLMPVQLTSTVVKDESGEPIAVLTISEDITRRRQAEEALRQSEARYALAARGANDGLWDWNLTTGEVFYSSRWKSMLGLSEDAVASSPEDWLSRVHPEDRPRLEKELAAHLSGATPHYQGEHRLRHQDGYRWFLSRGIAVADASGKPVRIAGSLTDVTERKQAEEQLLRDAFYDPLTGLPNRALFLDHLKGSLARLRRKPDRCVAVLMLDLDRFKNVNDSLGHAAGDRLLVEIARRLEERLRPGDTLARLGGDEFGVLVEDADGAAGTAFADDVRARLAHPFTLGEEEVFVSASIGIASSGAPLDRPEDLLRDADTALHRAKARGKARYEVFDPAMRASAVSLLRLESDLTRALERRELRVSYQPIVSLPGGRIAAFEALVRWNHPQRGLVLPDDFLPLAEETGLIVPLGRAVLVEACRQLRTWCEQRAAPASLYVSVNFSARHFSQPDLVKQVEQALAETAVQSSQLGIEITESAIMENPDGAARLLGALRDRGVRIHVDDFGTGYSSLSYLHRFPIDTLKIDKSFVSRMESDEHLGIVRTIVTLAHGLGMDVLAEGVETERQLELLRELDCDSGQGWLFSQALDGDAARALLEKRPRW